MNEITHFGNPRFAPVSSQTVVSSIRMPKVSTLQKNPRILNIPRSVKIIKPLTIIQPVIQAPIQRFVNNRYVPRTEVNVIESLFESITDLKKKYVFDIFIRDSFLYIISTYYKPNEQVITMYINGNPMVEDGLKTYEPIRYFKSPAPKTEIVTLTINTSEYLIPLQEIQIIKPSRHKCAFATLFKDDYTFIEKTVQYYRTQGVDYFYLFYNGSTLPSDLPTAPDIFYDTWDFPYWNTSHMTSSTIYSHNAQVTFITMMYFKYFKDNEWIIMADLDEWIINTSGRLLDILNKTKENAIYARNHWATFKDNNTIYYNTNNTGSERIKTIYRGIFNGLVGIHTSRKSSSRIMDGIKYGFKMLHIVDIGHTNRNHLISTNVQEFTHTPLSDLQPQIPSLPSQPVSVQEVFQVT